MPVPNVLKLYRIGHVETLPTLLTRGGLHAPNFTPHDGLPYRIIHSVSVQATRHDRPIWCGPRGTCHDYVPFYFGPLSVMLLNLKTGRVEGYNEGQVPLVYLTTTLQAVQEAGCRFVFSDGHGLARFTNWYEDRKRQGHPSGHAAGPVLNWEGERRTGAKATAAPEPGGGRTTPHRIARLPDEPGRVLPAAWPGLVDPSAVPEAAAGAE
ncbi:MAG: DUF4433 domain-containing protein [Bryobacterales bacterium]|nr:DUF4433 domain-containing protein [Bryobacterales bacterium]